MEKEMRLIDANALLEQDIYYDTAKCLIPRYEIERAPTVDAALVMHGQWIKRPDERICPFCNDRHSYFGGEEKNFCSNCGAKMEEREKNEPLELAELKQMDGEPVWVHNLEANKSFWMLAYKDVVSNRLGWLDYSGYGKTWIAYKYKQM